MPSEKMLMRGSHVVGEAAVRAGCRYYFGYPITPQNELPEYLSARLPELGGSFIQGESEVASINMVIGAAAAGGRAMTSSSSPGISLKQEGISYLAGMELPAVIINMMRGGPGLGNIAPSQADYFQATKGGGHGDYRLLVLAPAGCQELAELTFEAFDLADRYRNPVMLLGDGLMGQMMEPVIFPDPVDPAELPKKDYILNGCAGREAHRLFSMMLDVNVLAAHNEKLRKKYESMAENELRWETYRVEDADTVIVAYGTASRIAKGAVNRLRKEGLKVGLFRPISLFPYPKQALRQLAEKVERVCVFELSAGQMVEDAVLSVGGRAEIWFHGIPGGPIPTPADIGDYIFSVLKGDGKIGRRVEV
ncbi:MAG: 3-methyl-2-oxobutanoate dehydrogenase subunit VorB [Desulfatiglandaceae bacterium]